MNLHEEDRGPIAWMAHNPVAATLLMAVLIVGGFLTAFSIRQEVFPEFDLDTVQISVAYPGASPAEVEKGILTAIEERVNGLDGVKRVTSNAYEGFGLVFVELRTEAKPDKVLQDIKNGVDRITSMPREAERPVIQLLTNRMNVISLAIHGDPSEQVLREVAERTRDELLQNPRITLVQLSGIRPREVSIEVPQEKLRTYGLTLDGIARAVGATAVEVPAGGVKTRSGELLLRTAERRDRGQQFADIPVVTRPDGTRVQLGEIARIRDGFADTDEEACFNGRRAVLVNVFRVGDQTPNEVAAIVKEHAERLRASLPKGIEVTVWGDWSELYRDRMSYLLKDAAQGLCLVLLTLGLFMEFRTAFWVTMGIPTTFLGALLFMPLFGVTINMISLFGFMMALGMVVDNATVSGENIHELCQRGVPLHKAVVQGTREVVVPIFFSIATAIVSFLPMLFIPGAVGKAFRAIPLLLAMTLLLSLVEAFFIFPAHMGHRKPGGPGFFARLYGLHLRMSAFLERAMQALFTPVLRAALRRRALTVAIGCALLVLTAGYVIGGRIEFSFMSRVESDAVVARAALPYGSPVQDTQAVQDRLVAAARAVMAAHGGERISRGIYTQLGTPLTVGIPARGSFNIAGAHITTVGIRLVSSDQRPISVAEFSRAWRRQFGEVPGLQAVTFEYNIGPTSGAPIDIELSHPNMEVLQQAAVDLARDLGAYRGVIDIDNGYIPGKPQLDFKVKPEAQSLGVTAGSLALQVRSAFYGAEALRQQRGRDEVKVMVRLPEAERRSEQNVADLLIRTPQGSEMPLGEAATVERGRAYTEIKRSNGRRTLNVTADIEPGAANAEKVAADLQANVLPGLLAKYDGLRYSLGGEQRELREALHSLLYGFVIALIIMFALLAIPLKSYLQGLVIMATVPFGMAGAVWGHILTGYGLSIMSVAGMVALAGVVVNNSIVLVHAANERYRDGATGMEAMMHAGVRRLRPIFLTSVTTFVGLMPIIFETSVQAQFAIPMSVALGYGVLFATAVSLLLVPALYLLIEEDIKGLFRRE